MKFSKRIVILALACGIGNVAASAGESSHEVSSERCGGENCASVTRGLFAFVDRRLPGLKGNGRSCADCHLPADNLQLSPASAQARHQLLLWRRTWNPRAQDPLFLPIDADDFRTRGDKASDFSNLLENGLVRVTMPLPPNVRVIDPATNAVSSDGFVDVWRMVPSVFNVKLTGDDGANPRWARGPNPTGGYQLDGRQPDLQAQALGALQTHAQIAIAPPRGFLDDLAAFQNVLFSSPRVRALSDAVRAGTLPLPDTDPPLSALATQGKTVFTRACAQCHGGPGQSTVQLPLPLRFHDINSQCPRPVDTATPARFLFAPCPPRLARNARTYEITLANGTVVRRTSSDPGRALLTGFVGGPAPQDDWNKFDMTGLHGISRTAPYFHNNSADTLEQVVDHYIAFFKRALVTAPPGVVPPFTTTDGVNPDRQPLPEEAAALVAYLKTL
ncbi:MAG: c-type cytochrome [Steroidobacteraceae bacterium]|nr:c-type cytochrome [Steroidobacteraceae bacterium]